MSYNEAMSTALNTVIEDATERADANALPIQRADESTRMKALGSLVAALETSLKIVKARHYQAVPEPEPFPGACAAVIEQSLMGIELARKAGLIR